MEKATEVERLSCFGRALGSFDDRRSPDHTATASKKLLAAMKNEPSPFGLAGLINALNSLDVEIPVEQASTATPKIMAELEKAPTYQSELRAELCCALATIVNTLTAEQVAVAAKRTVDAINMGAIYLLSKPR
jgi:hypothetical protein